MDHLEIQDYNYLYLRKENTKEFIDYSKLVELYNTYLGFFVESDYSLYQNVDFLSISVSGFAYFHHSIFPEETIQTNEILCYVLEAYNRLKDPEVLEKKKVSLYDMNYILSTLCTRMNRIGDVNISLDILGEMWHNSYRINEVFQKSKTR